MAEPQRLTTEYDDEYSESLVTEFWKQGRAWSLLATHAA